MPIQLDKILADIACEKYLHPNYPGASKSDTDEAWERVSKSNKLSVHEARSIFKVLQKKYEQEKQKGKSAWKLYNIMEDIHRKVEIKPAIKEDEETDIPMEEDEEYEMFEVQEDDEHPNQPQVTPNSTGSTSASDSESPSKSNGSPEKDEKPPIVRGNVSYVKSNASQNSTAGAAAASGDEKKVLNAMLSATTGRGMQSTNSAVAALHKKGITLKKTNTPASATNTPKAVTPAAHNTQGKSITARIGGHMMEVGKTIHLPENIKRKLCEDQASAPAFKKIQITKTTIANSNAGAAADSKSATSQSSNAIARPTTPNTTTSQLLQIKKEVPSPTSAANAQGINLITIPANPTRAEIAQTVGNTVGPSSSTAATVASTASTNGFSPRIEEIDFRNDIIFDAGNGLNGNVAGKVHTANAGSDIINLGNFESTLPLTFFKNLCSSRHEALGLYVANVMNRLSGRSAAKLELGILRAIIDVQSDELEQ